MKNGIVRNWMHFPVVTLTPETRLSDARRIMVAENVRNMPVMRDGKLVGVITRRGLLRTDLSLLMDEPWSADVDLKDETVETVMTLNPLTIPPSASIVKAARVMLENKITGLPVMENAELVGIITSADILRAIIDEVPYLKERIQVSDCMTREVVTLTPDAPLLEAHRLMGLQRIRTLPVVKDGAIKGIVTRTDLMSSDPSRFASRNNQEQSLKILATPVQKIMSTNLITVTPETPIVEAAKRLIDHKIHSLLVTDAEGKLVGVITESDFFRLAIQKFA